MEKQKPLDKMGLIDEITGFPTERLLYDRLYMNLAYCDRFKTATAVCYVRMSQPNVEINVLSFLCEQVAERLKSSIRDIDTASFLSETDIVILLTDVTEHECNLIVERIIGTLSGAYTYSNNQFILETSMGVCIYPYDHTNSDDLLMVAKSQMYEALELGVNKYKLYKGKINEFAYRKMVIEVDLPHALSDGSFYIEYQPQVGRKERKVIGVETLIRWKHSKLGIIKPGEFLPLAEKIGLANDIFIWVFKEVCHHVKLMAPNNQDIYFSVNLSVNQLLMENIERIVSEIIDEAKINEPHFIFEVTENIHIYNREDVQTKLQFLRDIGCQIALDDFGNGYFSFSDFVDLPIDHIKLDKRFITSLMKNNKLTSVIIPIRQMTHNLGFKLVVEGIEDEGQFADWEKLGVDIFQGYLFSEPVTFDKLDLVISRLNKALN
jgi:EAL domain-containing protein (putative c-di-GMP-specific phosphodiesterase class I)/GGDEF domain-containing protein